MTATRLLAGSALAAFLASAIACMARADATLTDVLRIDGDPLHGLLLVHGLHALMLARALLPPIAPLLVGAAIWLVTREADRDTDARAWLAIGAAAFAVQRLVEAAVAVVAPAPTSVGAWLALPDHGPSLSTLARLVHLRLPGTVRYWTDALTVAAVVANACWARALAVAHPPPRDDPHQPLRRVAIAYVVTLAAVWLVAPSAVRALLRASG